ncbi:MAG: phosphomannomutase [Candidatus Methanoplasma sp.]|jgi:phosphoglucosamine mutase|nr:phosphomannomutase [Candidatus Methanoplasma sp.]
MTNNPALTLRSITDDDMTTEKALMIGRMVGCSYKTVCIGSDTSPSSRMIKNSLISGLLSAGADVNDADIAPAPAVALASRTSGCMIMVGEPNEQGVISRIQIMNSDGSIFTREQLRQTITNGEMNRSLPEYKGVGTARLCDSVTDNYNRVISEKYGRNTNAPVILDCGCGCTSVSAPQILASIGADLTTINAQNDPKYSPRPPGIGINDVSNLAEIVDLELGSIGIALNGDGTRLALIDEEGKYVEPENILALLLIYLKPSSLVVPSDASAVVDDAFRDLIGEGIKTDAKAHSDRHIIRADNDLESVMAAVKENNAEMGAMTDGTFIFPDITMCPDAINAAVILTKMSGENSISNLLASFPKYVVLKDSIHSPGNAELFGSKLADRLKELETEEEVWEIERGRVGMSKGWFAISRSSDNPEYIDITAEAKDKAYAVSMMELAKEMVRECI